MPKQFDNNLLYKWYWYHWYWWHGWEKGPYYDNPFQPDSSWQHENLPEQLTNDPMINNISTTENKTILKMKINNCKLFRIQIHM